MLSVVIPTRDKSTRLRLCLRALSAACTGMTADVEVIVVDDGGTAETRAVCEASPFPGSRTRYLCHPTTRGRSVARNTGAAASSGERLLFLDDDILLGPGAIAAHCAAGRPADHLARASIHHLPWLRNLADPTRPCGETPPGIATRLLPDGTGAELLAAARRLARRSRFESRLQELLSSTGQKQGGLWPAATGGNLSVGRVAFDRLGGFDEQMGLHWGMEDLEFGFRAESAGLPVVQLEGVVVYHMDHPTQHRAYEHRVALRQFGTKHGSEVETFLAAFFDGMLPAEEVVSP